MCWKHENISVIVAWRLPYLYSFRKPAFWVGIYVRYRHISWGFYSYGCSCSVKWDIVVKISIWTTLYTCFIVILIVIAYSVAWYLAAPYYVKTIYGFIRLDYELFTTCDISCWIIRSISHISSYIAVGGSTVFIHGYINNVCFFFTYILSAGSQSGCDSSTGGYV